MRRPFDLSLERANRCQLSHERGRSRHIKPGRYNTAVPAAQPSRRISPSPEAEVQAHIYKLEAAGILIIGALILILTLARYWHHIAWGAR